MRAHARDGVDTITTTTVGMVTISIAVAAAATHPVLLNLSVLVVMMLVVVMAVIIVLVVLLLLVSWMVEAIIATVLVEVEIDKGNGAYYSQLTVVTIDIINIGKPTLTAAQYWLI